MLQKTLDRLFLHFDHCRSSFLLGQLVLRQVLRLVLLIGWFVQSIQLSSEFYSFIDVEAHRFSPNVLIGNLFGCFVSIQLWTAIDESRVEYLPTRWQAQKEGKGFDFFFKVNPLEGELRQHLTEGVDVADC